MFQIGSAKGSTRILWVSVAFAMSFVAPFAEALAVTAPSNNLPMWWLPITAMLCALIILIFRAGARQDDRIDSHD
jgi:hypothetical protein